MVRAGIDGGFNHSSGLNIMTFKQAMQSNNADKLKKEVEKKHQRRVEHGVWIAMKLSKVYNGTKYLI